MNVHFQNMMIASELVLIPEGTNEQSSLRMHYKTIRRASLAKHGSLNNPPGDSIREAIRVVRVSFPEAKLKYDASYFKTI